jgi:zinc protease
MLSLLLLAVLTGAGAGPSPDLELSLALQEDTLDNGLRVLVLEDSLCPLVSVQVWYRVGSRHEHNGITGISHFLEHMMFKGTHTRAPGELGQEIKRYGGVSNAFTSEDKTVYWCTLPRSRLEFALEGEADRMVNLVFREFESERMVVKEERRRRYENQPGGKLYETLTAASYLAHPYENPVIGWMDDIDAITEDAMREHYRTYYAPDNAILVAVGGVTADEVFELARRHFGPIEASGRPNAHATREPGQTGERRVRVEFEGGIRMIGLAFHIPEMTHSDFPALYVLSTLMGDGKSSRLERSLIYEKNLLTSVTVWADRAYDPGLFYIIGAARKDVTPEEIERAILSEIGTIQDSLVSEREMMKAKNKLLHRFVFRQQSVRNRAYDIGYFGIVDEPQAINAWCDRLLAVTAEDVLRVARTYLARRNMTVALLGPGRS